jgi:hypothetical protein
MLGKTNEWDSMAVGMKVREVENVWCSIISSYGCIDGGFELAWLTWSKLEHHFAIRCNEENVDKGLADKLSCVIFGHNRYPKKLLNQLPVDLLVIEQGKFTKPIAG